MPKPSKILRSGEGLRIKVIRDQLSVVSDLRPINDSGFRLGTVHLEGQIVPHSPEKRYTNYQLLTINY
jgi:hypothetical protein